MPSRSPVIFWLLLTATMSVNAVAIYWVMESYSSRANFLYDGLVVGQLSLVCIWSALAAKKTTWTRISPLLAVAIAALGIGIAGESPITTGLPYYGLQAALLVGALWLIERTAFWQRRTGAATEWRYSVAHLLIITTVVAVLAAALRNSPHFASGVWLNFAYCFSYVAVAILGVVAWSLHRHWLLKLAGLLGFALVIGGSFFWYFFRGIPLPPQVWPELLGFMVFPPHLIQALVLSVWLGLWPILPISERAASD